VDAAERVDGAERVEGQAAPVTLLLASLAPLVRALRAQGYTVVGPTERDAAVVLAELDRADRLPYGWSVQVGPARYRLDRDGTGAFATVADPQPWKRYLHPPRAQVFSARRGPDGEITVSEPDPGPPPRYALLGVRPCDLRAIAVQDAVLGGADTAYARRRAGTFIVAVNCTEPGATCFCVSAGGGPRAGAGADLVLTELAGPDTVEYTVQAGTPAGAELLAGLPGAPVPAGTAQRAAAAVDAAAGRMGRALPPGDLRALLAGRPQAARWDDVAGRCLACGNCTMVCPTCFCTTVEDSTDLTGDVAQRWLRWDSCFDLDFSHLHGVGPVRPSVRGRYRQWLTHKLSTWHDQFGGSGCVGCGRCIVWCPAGIDLTVEVTAIAAEEERARVAAGTGGGEGGTA